MPPSEPQPAVPATPSAVESYLHSWHGMKVPVTLQFYNFVNNTNQVLAMDKLACTDGSALPVSLTAALVCSTLCMYVL
ncbi:MAG: hypothetical protein EOM68_31710 [Spirochaetia bacterium]|nr:hypothetical protein [Spirochaetia bacterium]